MKKISATFAFLVIAALTAMSQTAAAPLLWGNNARSSGISAFDATTGTLARQYPANAGHGRGVVVVDNVVYYTITDTGYIL